MNKGIFVCITLPSFLVATFIFHNAAAQTCTGNLVTNPGFESGLNDWSTTGDVTMSTNAYSGTKAAKVGGSGYASVGQLKPTTSGTSYTAKVWAKYSGSSFRVVELRFLNASWVTLSGAAQAEITSSVYSEYTLTGTAPAGAVYVYVIASKDGNGSIANSWRRLNVVSVTNIDGGGPTVVNEPGVFAWRKLGQPFEDVECTELLVDAPDR